MSTDYAWSGLYKVNDYKERFSYNPDGGILTLLRYGADDTIIDNATWNYYPGTHRLEHINDPAGRHGFDAGVQGANNYTYNAIGEMTGDVERGLTNDWTIFGKLKTQTINGATISYTYDAGGNRISKQLSNGYKEFYVRDASGTVLSIYRSGETNINNGDLTQAEVYLYGSSRLGMNKPGVNVQNPVAGNLTLSGGFSDGNFGIFTRGNKLFELTDHRSNNLVTISDRRQQVTDDNSTVSYYTANIITAQDYSSFGSLLQGRQYGYTQRYTYNGKQLDTETGWQDYGMRSYLVDVPVFASVDPLASAYPSWSPYPFAMNSPISGIDLDGLEYYYSADGRLLGNRTTDAQGKKLDDKTANSVRLATSVSTTHDEKTNTTNTVFNDEQDLNISHADFQKAAKVIKLESTTGDQTELLYIAHTSVNEANDRKIGVAELLSTTYSSVPATHKTPLSDDDNSSAANYARAGLIHALSGAPDPTNGAIRWDGTDLLAWGTSGPYGSHQKLREMGVEISEDIYFRYLQSNINKYGNSVKYGGKRYSLPHSVFKDLKYRPNHYKRIIYDNVFGLIYERSSIVMGTFRYPTARGVNKGKVTLKATATAGLSIFWAPIKK